VSAPPPASSALNHRDHGQPPPLTYMLRLLQDPWLGLSWRLTDTAVAAAIILGAVLSDRVLYRWDCPRDRPVPVRDQSPPIPGHPRPGTWLAPQST